MPFSRLSFLLLLALFLGAAAPSCAQKKKKSAARSAEEAAPDEFGISEQGDAAVKEKDLRKDSLSWLRSGTRMTFELKPDSGKSCLFHIQGLKIDNDVSWSHTSDCSMFAQGSQHLPRAAFDTTMVMHRGSPAVLFMPPPMWISRKFFRQLRENKTISLQHDQGDWKLEKKTTLAIMLDGVTKNLAVLAAVNEKGERFWVLDNAALPLLVKIDVLQGYDVTLLKAETK